MQVINWLELQPLLADVDALNARLCESQPVRSVCRFLVEITLNNYPWRGRSDLIPFYHPSSTYRPGQWLALPVPDPQQLRPLAWQVAQVKSAERTGNLMQGSYQSLVLDIGGREVQRTAGLTGTAALEPELPGWTPNELGRLVDWVADTYAGPLLATLRKLIQKRRVYGKLAGDTFLPEHLFALSLERIEPFFAQLSTARRWISIEEILLGLPDLSNLKHETALALVRATLKVSPYRSLGGDRWTTPQLLDQLDRIVPVGLPAAHIRSADSFWTGQDKKDLAIYRDQPIPAETASALEELGIHEERSGPDPSPWEPPKGRLRLPALSTLHITQACFPVGRLLHAFAPDARMVLVQWIDGKHQPFLLNREQGLLKAANPETLQERILGDGIPAGTHLWLEYQGGGKYRISPQPLAAPRHVSCKVVSVCDGKLHIEHSQTQLKYESEASVFRVDMHPEDIQALFAETKCRELSLRDALVSAIRELCAADPRKVASRSDLFNVVFLKRPCSPQAVAVLLYSLPCFVHLKGECFRYMNNAPSINVWNQANRFSRLWEDLAANCVAPDPREGAGNLPSVIPVEDQPFVTGPVPIAEHSAPHERVKKEVEDSSPAFPVVNECEADETPFVEKIGQGSVRLIKHALEAITTSPNEALVAVQDRSDDREVVAGRSEELEKITEEALLAESGPDLFPAMVKIAFEPDPQPTSVIETRRIAYGLKIPNRPLHKRPIYQRVFFCLRNLIHRMTVSS